MRRRGEAATAGDESPHAEEDGDMEEMEVEVATGGQHSDRDKQAAEEEGEQECERDEGPKSL